jgi:hypothetical protein
LLDDEWQLKAIKKARYQLIAGFFIINALKQR